MSPAWGVGINLAIQDAVATANVLAQPLLQGRADEALLAAVQQRRELPTRVTQFLQVQVHRTFAKIYENPGPLHAPWQLKLAVQVPGLQRVLGYAIGMGVRPEHLAERRPRAKMNPRKVAIFAAATALGILGLVLVTKNRR
jgi:2-polyprenyl-6-methoxyphenol hydroxylase-like FAD-dependent oxidoreductase